MSTEPSAFLLNPLSNESTVSRVAFARSRLGQASTRTVVPSVWLGTLRYLMMKIMEVTALCGYYTIVPMTPNAFGIGTQAAA